MATISSSSTILSPPTSGNNTMDNSSNNNMNSAKPTTSAPNISSSSNSNSAIPTLRVMRLQSPDLYMPSAGSFENRSSILSTAMCLPDSLGVVYVGETFTAYLGVLNVSKELPVKRLTVTAQLQTPSQRWRIPSNLDAGNASGGVDVPPESGVDTIISHPLEEGGNHILRVEVGYALSSNNDGNTTIAKTFRKFYRFNVTDPLSIRELTIRTKVLDTPPTDMTNNSNNTNEMNNPLKSFQVDIPKALVSNKTATSCCYVSITVEYNNHLASSSNSANAKSGSSAQQLPSSTPSIVSTSNCITIASAEFRPVDGLRAERVMPSINCNELTTTTAYAETKSEKSKDLKKYISAVDLLDNCGRLQPGDCYRYLFKVMVDNRSTQEGRNSNNYANNTNADNDKMNNMGKDRSTTTATSSLDAIKSTTTKDSMIDLQALKSSIAAGDEIGKAIFTWSKTMGETGRIVSSSIYCPENKPLIDNNDPIKTMTGGNGENHFIMNGSGLTDDITSVFSQNIHHNNKTMINAIDNNSILQNLNNLLPISIEPINPPTKMKIAVPYTIQFKVTNHTTTSRNIQVLFPNNSLPSSSSMKSYTGNNSGTAIKKSSGGANNDYLDNVNPQHREGLVVCGHSCRTIGTLHGCNVMDSDNPHDNELNTKIVEFKFIGLAAGLSRCIGCCLIDLSSSSSPLGNNNGRIPQPPLFDVLVEK